MPLETELKLQIEPNAVAFLEASDLLGAPAATVKQRSLYFDTPDQKLRANSMSLRIRRAGKTRVQTLKIASGGMAGIFERSEWEVPIESDEPRIDGLEPLIEIVGKKAHKLSAIFEIQNERRSWILREGQSEVELALDQGAAIAAGRTSPIYEIELELRFGQTCDLFSLARKIDTIVPIRLGVQTKSERGYDLLGPVHSTFDVPPLMLGPKATIAEAFRGIAFYCVQQYRFYETLLLEMPNPKAVHQARVSLRRLRSAFSIFKSCLENNGSARFKSDLRTLAATLGEARNLDVLMKRQFSEAVEKKMQDARLLAYAKVDEMLRAPASRALILDLVEWLDEDEWSANKAITILPVTDFAQHKLDRLRRRLKENGRQLAQGSDMERHEVRKDAKKLRYASEFFGDLFDKPKQQRHRRKFLHNMEKLQDELGALNDLATAEKVMNNLRIEDADRQSCGNRDQMVRRATAAWNDLINTEKFWS